MSQSLIEKQGKYYKEVEVVMLEISNEFVDIGAKNWYLQNSKVLILDNKKSNLYFLSDEKIKEGDWYIRLFDNTIQKANVNSDHKHYECKKIIATTDELVCKVINRLLWVTQILPQPSPEFIQAFIEAYNEGKPITKVLVEYNQICHKCHNLREDKTCCSPVKEYHKNNHEYVMKLKDNQIIIKKIEEKMYSESEVVTLILKMQNEYTKYKQECHFGPNSREIAEWTDNWIKQNLK